MRLVETISSCMKVVILFSIGDTSRLNVERILSNDPNHVSV